MCNHVSQAFAEKLAGKNVSVAEWVMLRDAAFFGHLSRDERAVLQRLLKRLAEHGQMRAIPLE